MKHCVYLIIAESSSLPQQEDEESDTDTIFCVHKTAVDSYLNRLRARYRKYGEINTQTKVKEVAKQKDPS
jgi:hypothetical protein